MTKEIQELEKTIEVLDNREKANGLSVNSVSIYIISKAKLQVHKSYQEKIKRLKEEINHSSLIDRGIKNNIISKVDKIMES